jgi:hypothetical protein
VEQALRFEEADLGLAVALLRARLDDRLPADFLAVPEARFLLLIIILLYYFGVNRTLT